MKYERLGEGARDGKGLFSREESGVLECGQFIYLSFSLRIMEITMSRSTPCAA
jgi:butyrate kinase